MKQIQLGKYLDQSGDFTIDINRLIETRLLVQASSGGGKSWLLRKLVESCHGKVHLIIIDIEGEFATLREKYDFIVAGSDGDVQIDPRHAPILARKVLELRADIICDLYELKPHERIRFVRQFLDAMVNAKKELWHPTLIILDEAHLFAPEKGQAESLPSVIDMASRGRKRGFALVPATQRLSKLHKDVAAECQNKLIGLANMDIDRKRCADELGFSEREKIITLRDLAPGEFYAVGPSFHRGVHRIQVGAVQTKHPSASSTRTNLKPPAPTSKVKEQLAKLADLPRTAEEELRDVEQLLVRVRELEREVKTKPASASGPEALKKAYQQGADNVIDSMKKQMPAISQFFDILEQKNKSMASDMESFKANMLPTMESILSAGSQQITILPKHLPKALPRAMPIASRSEDHSTWGICERKIISFLALRPGDFFTKVQVGAMTGYRHGSGGFNNSLSKLTQAGLIQRQNGAIALNPGADVAGLIVQSENSLQEWINRLGKCEREIYQVVLEQPKNTLSKQEIAEITQYSAGSGGFNNALSRLNTLGLIRRNHDGRIGINPELLEI